MTCKATLMCKPRMCSHRRVQRFDSRLQQSDRGRAAVQPDDLTNGFSRRQRIDRTGEVHRLARFVLELQKVGQLSNPSNSHLRAHSVLELKTTI